MKFAYETFFLIFLLTGTATALDEDRDANTPCWADDNFWLNEGINYPLTSNLGKLKTLLLPIDLTSPASDAAVRYGHGDLRFLAIGGFTESVPGVDRFAEDLLICRYGTRFLEGTTDAVNGNEHLELIGAFTRYAEAYNLEMRRLLGESK